MEEQEKTENSKIEKDLLLENSSILENDSNSLEPGEVVEEKTPPRQLADAEDKAKFSTSIEGDSISGGSGCNTVTPSKPVLGKEKAKQRLKALGIQKKIQLESKNTRLPQKRKKPRDKSATTPKKDKPPTPHEKAKLTKEEIEKMKEKQDCAIPCFYYDEAMIHHIRAECSEEKSSSNKVEPCLTASLEAIKNYEDQDEPPAAGGAAAAEIDRTAPAFKRRRYMDDNIRNYKQTRRKLFHGEKEAFGPRMRDKGNKQIGLNRERLIKSSYRSLELRLQNRRRLSEQSKQGNRPLKSFEALREAPLCKEDGLMYTKTKPFLSFAFNSNVVTLQSLQSVPERRRKKSKKRSKERRESHEDGSKKKKRSKQSRHEADGKKSSKKKSGKKVFGSGSEEKSKKGKRSKSHKSRKKKSIQSRGALSFHLDEFYPEEETDSFPLCKDGVTAVEEVEEDDLALENKLKSLQEELNKKSPSPDTDDYMANWEEEEDFVPIPRSKDTTPILGADAILGVSDEEAEQPKNKDPIQFSYPEDIESRHSTKEGDEEEIRDGLGTPIFVNPSPPAELLVNVVQNEELSSPSRTPERMATSLGADENNVERSRPRSNPLFGMQVIYEQFIQSVNDAGIELSLEQRHSKEESKSIVFSPLEEESSFTPNTSPGKTAIATTESEFKESVSHSSQLLNVEECASDSTSSTPSPSSRSESSSSSSSTVSSNENYDDPYKSKNGEEKSPQTLDPQLSVLSPEDSKKLHSLQKRWRMLKTLQEQSDTMDDEDIQCLLGLEKLIEAEKSLLMRKYELNEKSELTSEEGKELETTDGKAAESFNLVDTGREDGMQTPLKEQVKMCADLGKIFDVNREAVKLTISPKVQKSVPKAAPAVKRSDEEDDQDFTEKLLKPLKDIPEKEQDNRDSKEIRTKIRSPVQNRSSEFRKSIVRKGRSLSISPSRRSRAQTERSRRPKRRQYSPLVRHLRSDSPISRKRHELRRSRERKRSLSPAIRRRSRSPYCRRFSRSPPFRPPSPKSPPPPSRDSRSPSKERSPCLENPPGSAHHYLWSDELPLHYYSGYYYPSASPTHQTSGNQTRPYSGVLPYSNYSHYNTYPGDYAGTTGYANNYGNEYIGSEPMDSYSRIPVINSTGANYYYNEFGGTEPQRQCLPDGSSGSRQQTGPGVKSSTFAVQKGNVLEIVPTPVIPKQEPGEPIFAAETSDESQNVVGQVKDGIEDSKEEEQQQSQVKKEKTDERKRKRRPGDLLSWEDEVAKRHIMSAVIRLNKEGDGTLRGILCSKTNPDVQPKEKKKVLFADGIPPGKCSSTSDEDSLPPNTVRKRARKKRRRGENKENENAMLNSADGINEFKVDPELENAPPPPPPPGSPPQNLEQPVLIRPPSPEQLLYFHYDGVVNSMYVSQLATPIPPRLLNRGIPQILPTTAGNCTKMNSANIATSKENEIVKESPKEGGKDIVSNEVVHSEGASSNTQEGIKELSILTQEIKSEFNTEMVQPETTAVPEPEDTQPPSPAIQLSTESLPVRARGLTPPPVKSQMFAQATGDPRPLSPVIPGFIGFNRPPPRTTVGVLRPDFSIPPPPTQIQSMLSHPSIPFGPRPPGGSANFNRNVPPPFNLPQQHLYRSHGMSPSPFNNSPNCDGSQSPGVSVMHSPGPTSSVTPFRSPTIGNSTPGYPPAPPVRGPGMCSSFRSPGNFDNSSTQYSSPNVMGSPSFTPPVGSKQPMSSIMGKPPQFHGNNNPPPHQFHQNNNTPALMNTSTPLSNFNATSAPHNIRPPPPHPFSSNGMLSQMHHHRPNLGFPRSFGPPRPPPPPQHGSPHQQHMYGGQPPIISPNQLSHNMPPFASAPRSMYPSPGGIHHFLRIETNGQRVPPNATASAPAQQQQQQQQPLPHPSSPIGRTHPGTATNNNL